MTSDFTFHIPQNKTSSVTTTLILGGREGERKGTDKEDPNQPKQLQTEIFFSMLKIKCKDLSNMINQCQVQKRVL